MRFTVSAPGSSANLGPGFDALGLALDLWNEVEIDLDVLRLAPAHGHPRVRGHEVVFGIFRDDGQRIARPQLLLHLIGHDGATQSRTEDDDVSHDLHSHLTIYYVAGTARFSSGAL